MGFWVARTMKGFGSRCVSLSMETSPVFMASSRADCVLGGGAVNLVRQHDIAEQGPGLELEPVVIRVVGGDAENVRREHVARELNAGEGQVERTRDEMREGRLADPRHILEQDMALSENSDECAFDDIGLALDDAFDVGVQFLDFRANRVAHGG
jgi:hypothetical protein